jgi:hypothetical protein
LPEGSQALGDVIMSGVSVSPAPASSERVGVPAAFAQAAMNHSEAGMSGTSERPNLAPRLWAAACRMASRTITLRGRNGPS